MSWKTKLKAATLAATTFFATSCGMKSSDVSEAKQDVVDPNIENFEGKIKDLKFYERSDANYEESGDMKALRLDLNEAGIPMIKGDDKDSILVSVMRENKGTEEKPQYEYYNPRYVKRVTNDYNGTSVITGENFHLEGIAFDENTPDIKFKCQTLVQGAKEAKKEAIEENKKRYYEEHARTGLILKDGVYIRTDTIDANVIEKTDTVLVEKQEFSKENLKLKDEVFVLNYQLKHRD